MFDQQKAWQSCRICINSPFGEPDPPFGEAASPFGESASPFGESEGRVPAGGGGGKANAAAGGLGHDDCSPVQCSAVQCSAVQCSVKAVVSSSTWGRQGAQLKVR